jgi:hypothetical protein
VRTFFEKAVAKRPEQDRKKKVVTRTEQEPAHGTASEDKKPEDDSDKEGHIDVSDDERTQDGPTTSATPVTPLEMNMGSDALKRKRVDAEEDTILEADIVTTNKRARSATPPGPPPPPPPPPPTSRSIIGETDEHESFDMSYRIGALDDANGHESNENRHDSMEDSQTPTMVYVEGQHAS